MQQVQPEVYFIADPCPTGELDTFFKNNSISWRPSEHAPWSEQLIETAGRLCYLSWPNDQAVFENLNLTRTRETGHDYFKNILKSGHGSILEHGNLVFIFDNVSRVFTHELVRHRTGCAYSQTSGRFVRTQELSMWCPDVISKNPEANTIFNALLVETEEALGKLNRLYKKDLEQGSFQRKKELTSAFRRIAPTGVATKIMFSTNHRALRHILVQRTSCGAETEIREIFWRVALKMAKYFPNIYQDMLINEDKSVIFKYGNKI